MPSFLAWAEPGAAAAGYDLSSARSRGGVTHYVSDDYRAKVHRWTWWFGLILGGLLVVAGIAETVRLVRSGDGGFWFWFPTLVCGGALLVAGTLLLPRLPILGCVLTTVGALAAILPTVWTVVVPVLLLVLVIVSAKQAAGAGEAGTAPR